MQPSVVCENLLYVLCTPEPRILFEAGTEEREEEEEGRQDCDHLTFFPVLNETVTEAPPPESTPEPCSHTYTCPDTHIILQSLDPGEEVIKRGGGVVVLKD